MDAEGKGITDVKSKTYPSPLLLMGQEKHWYQNNTLACRIENKELGVHPGFDQIGVMGEYHQCYCWQ